MADRTLPNPERGCGYLKGGKAYLRGTVGSVDGILPSFVKTDPIVPYREMGTDGSFTRGYQQLDGVTAEAALETDTRAGVIRTGDGIAKFVPCYPGDADDGQAVMNMVDRGLYDTPESVPDVEYQRHIDRVASRGGAGETHFGAIDAVRQSDLLMRAGKTHYPTPDDFIDEAIEHGISKAIPLSKRQEPPEIQPGGTRCWIVHPDTEVGWGVIGYAYIQEVVFTEPDDGNVPEYVQEYHAAGRLDVVDFEDSPDEAEANGNATVDDFADTGGDAGQTRAEATADQEADGSDDTADVVVPDDRDNDQDVRGVAPDDAIRVVKTDGSDHITPVGDETTLCGRQPAFDEGETMMLPADSKALIKKPDIDVCGTCLTALKARQNDEDDEDNE